LHQLLLPFQSFENSFLNGVLCGLQGQLWNDWSSLEI